MRTRMTLTAATVTALTATDHEGRWRRQGGNIQDCQVEIGKADEFDLIDAVEGKLHTRSSVCQSEFCECIVL